MKKIDHTNKARLTLQGGPTLTRQFIMIGMSSILSLKQNRPYAIRDRDGDGPGAGRNARAERNPEIEEGLKQIRPNRGIKEDRKRSMFSS